MFGKNKKEIQSRFIVKSIEEPKLSVFKVRIVIIVDRITGVNYMMAMDLGLGEYPNTYSLTPLLGSDGKPIVDDVSTLTETKED